VSRSHFSKIPLTIAGGIAGVIAIVSAVFLHPFSERTAATTAVRSGRLTVDSGPVNAELVVDGQLRGATPLTIALGPGEHRLILRTSEVERTIPVRIGSGDDVRQYVDLGAAAAHAPALGKIFVLSDPPKQQVSVDGQRRGVSPLLVEGVVPGEHQVTLAADTVPVARKAVVEEGATAFVVFGLPKDASTEPTAGWLKVSAPFECQILEKNELVGTTSSARTMLPAGRHEIRLVNQALGFQESRRFEVTAGKTTNISVTPPKGELSANASPWADVFVDGKPIGQTPLGQILLPIGSHEIVFHHPQLGDRQQSIVITAKGPNRASVDLSK
jgi:hypothetical protein